jgi:hypothetical protein
MPGARLGPGDMEDVKTWLDEMEAHIKATRAELI